ncbi:MAG TPA: hypothetical protein VMB76_09650 [Casimicrobiaceae bacterium]|nr:hypothetical protein [Casimicrobiaceae bacterium]
MSWDEYASTRIAPRDALSPQFPFAPGLIFVPPRRGFEPLDGIARHLEARFGVRAWLGWMGDDGHVRVIVRIPPGVP